jgi:hypothetical protein
MTRHIAAASLILAGLAAGCRPKLEAADEFRRGVPREETVKVVVPDKGQAQGLTVEGQSQALRGGLADYWALTFGVTSVMNGGAAFVGVLVKTVISYPPTSLTADTAVWGPFSSALDPINWRVTVKRTGDNKFEYAFDGQSKIVASGPFVTVLAGTHTAAVDDQGDPIEGFGAGSFTLDWDARQKLPLANPNEVGSASYSYSRLPGADGTIDAQFHQVKDKDTGKLIDADYKYVHHQGGSGTMDFSFDAAAQLGMADGRATVRSRWQPDGAGRADATLTSSTLPAAAAASECWSTTFQSTFMKRSWAPLLDYGTEATDCVYPTADFSHL